MGIEGEPHVRDVGTGTNEHASARPPGVGRAARPSGLERALEEVRQVGVEASGLLRTEGLKPARLYYVPRDARSYPLVGRALSKVGCGRGWHVVRGVVVGTDGRLWARRPVHDPTPQRDLDAWRLEVEPPGGPAGLPGPVAYDGTSLHTVRWISDDEYTKTDLVDRLTDGYARLLILHHRRRSGWARRGRGPGRG